MNNETKQSILPFNIMNMIMKTVIKIKRDTVRPNPEAGQTTFFVPGRAHQGEDGSWHREVQHIHSIFPAGSHLFEYEDDAVIECEECHTKIRPSEFQADAMSNGDDEIWSNNICPHCGEWDCCEFEYESLESVLKEKAKGVDA